jgi:hypothetical protein
MYLLVIENDVIIIWILKLISLTKMVAIVAATIKTVITGGY